AEEVVLFGEVRAAHDVEVTDGIHCRPDYLCGVQPDNDASRWVALQEGFEPSTVGLEVRCSDPLSYGRLSAIVADAQAGSAPNESYSCSSACATSRPCAYWNGEMPPRSQAVVEPAAI